MDCRHCDQHEGHGPGESVWVVQCQIFSGTNVSMSPGTWTPGSPWGGVCVRRPVRLGPCPPQVLRRPQPDQEDTRTEPELLQVNRKSREWSKHVENKRVLQGSTGFYRVWTRSPTRVRQQTWDQFQLVSLSGDTRIRCWLLRYQLLADTSPQDWKNRWFNAFIHGRLCHCWMTLYMTVVQLLLRHGVTEKKSLC